MKLVSGIVAAGIAAIGVGVWAQTGGQKPGVVPDGDWQTLNRDYAATRYSPLKQITAANVGTLVPVWCAQQSAGGSAVPIVVNGVMYVGSGTTLRALDGVTGKEIWTYSTVTQGPLDPPAAPAADAQQPAAVAGLAPGCPPPGAGGGGGRRGGGAGGPGGGGRAGGAIPGAPAGPGAGAGGGAVAAAPGAAGGARAGGAVAAAPGAPAGGRPGGAPGGGGQAGGRGRGGGAPSISQRGVSYWPGDATHPPMVVIMTNSRIWEIDAATGKLNTSFGENGSIPVGNTWGGTPTIYRNVAIIGAQSPEVPKGPDPGNPRAFDLVTGKKLWEFQTVPKKGEPFNDTWGGDSWETRQGTNMWGMAAAIDAERGIAYLPIAGPAANYYGGDRPGNNAFGNSIVAVDVMTGKYLWHFQTVHHDLWDIDLPSAGALITVTQNGRQTPAIAHVGKSSYFFVLNRQDGKPLIPVEERPVPKGDVPTEWYSPTQPIPVRPGPLSPTSFNKETDMVRPEDTTPEHAAACQKMWDDAGGYINLGPFTPFMYHEDGKPPRSTIQLPGGTGGVNWGGVAADPASGIVYANAQTASLVGWVEKVEMIKDASGQDFPKTIYPDSTGAGQTSRQPYNRAAVDGKGPFHSFTAMGMPCIRPPWGQLVAVNANTGEILWKSVLGTNPRLPEGKQLVGGSGSAGPTVTAGGIVFVGATSDGRFRAFDAKSGKQLWEKPLTGAGNANPMTYNGKNGKQYVAIVSGGTVNVFSLP